MEKTENNGVHDIFTVNKKSLKKALCGGHGTNQESDNLETEPFLSELYCVF